MPSEPVTEQHTGRDTPTATTIVAANYLPAARVLARSYLAHHPGHRFVITVIDQPWEADRTEEDYRIVGPGVCGLPREDYLRMATAYSVTELATAVKPALLRALRADSDVVIFLDPDIRVYAPMPELPGLALTHQIVLAPHFLRPLPRDGYEPDEAVIMSAGVFNLGFVAVGPGSEDFLEFWAERLRQDAIVAPEQQLFTDQRWVDLVPSLFPHHVLRDPGYDVAYWNAHERQIGRYAGTGLTAGGEPLRFYHFSGYRPEKPWQLTYHCARRPRILLSANPVLRQLCDDYGAALQEAGYAETLDAIPYGFRKLDDGTTLTPTIRRLFRAGWIAAERTDVRGPKPEMPPYAFGPDGDAALRDWLSAPATTAEAGAGLNRLTTAIWESRPDLQVAFRRPFGADAADFRHWCRKSGPVEGVLPDWALPGEPPAPSEPDDEAGVNVVGYLTAELGLGEMGRIVHDAIRRSGLGVASVVEERSLSNRTGVDAPETVGAPRFPVSLLCVNADQTQVILDNHPEAGHHRYRIGLWAWELEDFPAWQHPAFGLVDEVWTVSDFCREAIAAHSPVPVKTIPVPVRDPGPPARRVRPAGEPVRFLFAFDFNSIGERKNPWGLVEAFRRAFPTGDDARLVIKAINGDLNHQAAERLRGLIAEDQRLGRIELLERYLGVAELDALYAGSDCYVSLHRSEGFGLTVAEAMARGLPVICTDYSSTTEFVTGEVGWPVPWTRTEVGPGNFPYQADATWAEPDLDAAAAAMRAVADDPAEAARRGAAARAHVLATRPVEAAAAWMAEQLTAAHATWQRRRTAPAAEAAVTGDDPMRPLREAKEALRWRPASDTDSRLPLAPAMRRVVLRAIDHYDVHQRAVLGALTEGTEETLGRLLNRVEALERELGETRADAARGVRLAGDVREDVDRLSRVAPGTDRALRNLEGDVAGLRDAAGALADGTDELRERVERDERETFAGLAERDRRTDADELTLQQVKRDVGAVHAAAALRHAPVPAGTEVVLCDAGALLVPADDVVAPWLAHHRSWEAGEAELMTELMSSMSGPATFLDVGAHVGYHTLRLLRAVPAVAGVVAVEANPDTVALLRRNLAVNLPAELNERVTVLPVAAWDAAGEVRLTHAEAGNSGDHRVRPDGAGTAIPAVRLDAEPSVRANRVGLVKVDLQGRDHRALAGLAEVLERDRPHVVCEFDPAAIAELGDDPEQVLLGYRKLGYQPVPLRANGTVDSAEEHTDRELVAAADAAEPGFLTVWLRPAE